MRSIQLTAVVCCLFFSTHAVCQSVTLTVKDVQLEVVFKEITRQTGFEFFYKDAVLKVAPKVTLTLTNAPIDEALVKCFKNQQLTYSIVGKTIVVKQALSTPTIDHMKDAADAVISGTVTDTEGLPLEAASVQVKGTQRIAVTDAAGKFTIQAQVNDMLRISIVGFSSRDVKITAQTINVQMTRQLTSLEETVVYGYGSGKRKDLVGSISTVTAKEIEEQPVANPMLAIQGRMPGVLVSSASGKPGTQAAIEIRGSNSIAAGRDPLYVIDGVPVPSNAITPLSSNWQYNPALNPFNTINPTDIESITVLKDADATAIYGSRGSNGVVLITTKKGRWGKSSMDVSVSSGFSKSARFISFLDTRQYLDIRRKAFAADGVAPDVHNAPDLLLWDTTINNNWPKILYGKSAPFTDIQAGLSGGSDALRYLVSISHHDEGTILIGGGYDRRTTIHSNMDYRSVNKLLIVSTSVTYGDDNLKIIDFDPYRLANAPPNLPLHDSAGGPFWFGDPNFFEFPTNAIAAQYVRKHTATDNFIARVNARYQVLANLDLSVSAGYTKQNQSQVTPQPSIAIDPRSSLGFSNSSEFNNSNSKTYIVEPQINYKLSFPKSKILVLLGSTWQRSSSQTQSITGINFPSDELLENIGNAGSIYRKSAGANEYRYESVFGRVSYTWQEKLIINGVYRRDGSSRFGSGKRFGSFWSSGAGWVFSQSSFAKNNLSWLSYGKIRGSIGITGNDQIGDYGYLQTYGPTYNPYGGTPGLAPNTLANVDYSWETNRKLEFATDLFFFDNRLSTTVAWFNSRASNQLVDFPIASQSGFSSFKGNLPATVNNKGWEIQCNVRLIERKAFSWSTSANITFYKNRLTRFPGIEASYYNSIYEVGKSVNIFKRFLFTGIDRQTGVPTFFDADKNGQIEFFADFVAVGSKDPTYYGGLNNHLSYQNVSLDIFFQFQKQQGYGNLQTFGGNPPGTLTNVNKEQLENYWQKPGDAAAHPGLTATPGSDIYNAYINYLYSSAAIEDASFVRLKNVALSYSINPNWVKKAGFTQATVFVNGQNLLTLTKYHGSDPETQVNSPALKTIVAGIRFTL